MENPIDFTKFKEKKDLEVYCVSQYLAILSASNKITELQNKIVHLENLLTASVQITENNNVSKIIKSPELCLVEAQIGLLVREAMYKQLTLEETKQLDLLIKNKRLLCDESTTIEGNKKPKRELSEAQLISIARVTKKDV